MRSQFDLKIAIRLVAVLLAAATATHLKIQLFDCSVTVQLTHLTLALSVMPYHYFHLACCSSELCYLWMLSLLFTV